VIGKKGLERRQHERIALKDRVFITIRPLFDRIGWITDISRGGVSFEISTIQEYSVLSAKLSVDIFSSPRKYEISNLPCRLVYDDRIDRGNGYKETIETRRCGLAFVDMSYHQVAQIEAVLSQCDSIEMNT
jgi:hypothetical protein